jgi:hypothetical protein
MSNIITLDQIQPAIISHAAGEKGTFLAIDRESVRAVVQSTLAKLGIDATHRPQERTLYSRASEPGQLPTVKGFRLYDQWSLGFNVEGPNGEPMQALLKIQDSTVPGMAFRVSVGVLRLICLNGMFGFGTEFETRVNHRVGQSAFDKLAGLPAAIEAALKGLPQLAAAAEGLAAVPVADPIDVLLSLNIPEKVRENAISIIGRQAYRFEDQPTDAWGLYNIVNEVDRLLARKGSTAYLERDERLADDIICLASAQEAA